MASKTTLNAKNLEALGVAHLAELLMDISEGNANARRRLRLELAGRDSPEKLANEIRKRLTAIGVTTAHVGWRTLKGFRGDLNTQRRLIVEQLSITAPGDAAELMWSFIALGESVIERSSDLSGGVIQIFRDAASDLAALLAMATMPVDVWLPQAVTALLANSYGQNDGLTAHLAPLLGDDGLERLREDLVVGAKDTVAATTVRPRSAKRWRKRALAASDSLRKRSRSDALRVALIAIADARGDVDAYIGLMADAYLPATSAQIADRLLRAGRAEDALKALDGARMNPRLELPAEWIDARIAVLEALDRKGDAQDLRLDRFHHTLDAAYLRAYLKRLPDFEDIEAEDEALDRAKDFPDAHASLQLLVPWPSLERAADLVVRRIGELDGNDASGLTFAADRLSSRYPFAAMLLHRQIVEAALVSGREPTQAPAAVACLEAESLARHIDDFGRYGAHDAWISKLRTIYSRRTAFWKALG